MALSHASVIGNTSPLFWRADLLLRRTRRSCRAAVTHSGKPSGSSAVPLVGGAVELIGEVNDTPHPFGLQIETMRIPCPRGCTEASS